MPTLSISTNVPVDGLKTYEILKDSSKAVARVLGKDDKYMMVLLHGSVPLSFGGSEEPAAYGELSSIGAIVPDTNRKLSKVLSEILRSKLNVPASRFYIKFSDVKASNYGWNGTTF